jgi:hypothetical protein
MAGASVRPLNFTVRGRDSVPFCDMPRHFSSGNRTRLIILAIVAIAFTINWAIGRRLYPQYYLLVTSMAFAVAFFLWLIDAIVVSVRARRRARAQQLR